MIKYPKKLPRLARLHSVEDEQAKAAWCYVKFLATVFMLQEDFEFQNLQLDAQLRTIGAVNTLLAQSLLVNQDKKFRLVSGR